MPRYDTRSVFIGFDPREADAFMVARHSVIQKMTTPAPVHGLVLDYLRARGLYYRPTHRRGEKLEQLWDVISDAPMSTEFAISRFLVPYLAGYQGWAVFMDSDVLLRGNLARLFDCADPHKAVQVVKHHFAPPPGIKMDGQIQTAYPRKNWSSVILFNCAHPANSALTPACVNSRTGRDLHQFCWLSDDEIGELDPTWNFLVGHHSLEAIPDPALVHFTDGIPSMPGYENSPFADEWRDALGLAAAGPKC